MTPQQSQHLSRALSSLYQVEMLQKMAMASDGVLDHYPIHEYAFILETVIDRLSSALHDLDDGLNKK